jgi:hypothetical protein
MSFDIEIKNRISPARQLSTEANPQLLQSLVGLLLSGQQTQDHNEQFARRRG